MKNPSVRTYLVGEAFLDGQVSPGDGAETPMADASVDVVSGGWVVETAGGRIYRGPGRLQPGDLARAMGEAGETGA